LRTDGSALLTSSSNAPPLFVEFADTPKSGKSTCIDTVNHCFRLLQYKVLSPSEGASKRTPYYLKEDLVSFNAWSAMYALTHILEGRHSTDQYNLAILDWGLFDALAWFELLKTEKHLSNQDCTTIQEFFLLDHWREGMDIVFLFVADPMTSLNRENQSKLIAEPGQAMNPIFQEKPNHAYEVVQKKFADRFSEFYRIDTSESQTTTTQSTAFEVTKHIIESMRKRSN